MAITKTFNRPKLNTTLDEDLVLGATVIEDPTNNRFIIELTATVTKDDSSTATKVLSRVFLPFEIQLRSFILKNPIFYVFPGSAVDSTGSGTIPALNTATLGNSVDLNLFLSLAGDSQTNS